MATPRRIIMGLIVVFALIQLIPVTRTNPAEPDPIVFTDPNAEALAKRACYACHANTNTWDWYSYIAPVSWIYVHHVDEGRSTLNFSDIAGTIANGGERGERGEGMVTRAYADEENESEAGEATQAGGSRSAEIVEEIAESIQEGEMPPAYYSIMHRADATLTAEEQTILINGIRDALAGR